MIWQQQLQSFSWKIFWWVKKYKHFYEFYSYFNKCCSVQKAVPSSLFHYAVVKPHGTTRRQYTVPPLLLCSTDTVPKGQQPVLPHQQRSEWERKHQLHHNHCCCSDSILESHLPSSFFINNSEQLLPLLTCAIAFWLFLNTVALRFGVVLRSSLLFFSCFKTNKTDQKTYSASLEQTSRGFLLGGCYLVCCLKATHSEMFTVFFVDVFTKEFQDYVPCSLLKPAAIYSCRLQPHPGIRKRYGCWYRGIATSQ